jgi:Tol biopolymer transport system component
MKSIAIDPQTGDFIRENGRMRYTDSDLEFMAQVVKHELSLFLGEWFMDTSKGIPYIPKENRKSQHRAVLESALRSKLTKIKGIKKVISFIPEYDKSQRLYTVRFVVQTDQGQNIEDTWKAISSGGIE